MSIKNPPWKSFSSNEILYLMDDDFTFECYYRPTFEFWIQIETLASVREYTSTTRTVFDTYLIIKT